MQLEIHLYINVYINVFIYTFIIVDIIIYNSWGKNANKYIVLFYKIYAVFLSINNNSVNIRGIVTDQE